MIYRGWPYLVTEPLQMQSLEDRKMMARTFEQMTKKDVATEHGLPFSLELRRRCSEASERGREEGF